MQPFTSRLRPTVNANGAVFALNLFKYTSPAARWRRLALRGLSAQDLLWFDWRKATVPVSLAH